MTINIPMLSIAGLLSLTAVPIVASAGTSCVTAANQKTASALSLVSEGHHAAAAALQYEAAELLEDCMRLNRAEVNASSTQRLGELWMYAGEYYTEAQNLKAAASTLERAKKVFRNLRASGVLAGSALDEVLLDAHRTDQDLMRVAQMKHPN